MKPATAASALKVQAALGPAFAVVEFEVSTKTAEDTARVLGCAIAEIAKTLVFRGKQSGDAVLVVTAGTNRVDEGKIAALIGFRPRGTAKPWHLSALPLGLPCVEVCRDAGFDFIVGVTAALLDRAVDSLP